MSITTIARVEEFRTLTGAMKTKAENRLAAAERHIIGKLGYDPTQVLAGAVRVSGTGTQFLSLPGPIPITAVSSLVVDRVTWTVMNPGDAEAEQYVWVPDHGQWLEARGDLVFTEGRGNIACTRTAGYATADMPADLQDVVAMFAVLLFQEGDNRLGVDSKTLSATAIEKVLRNWSAYELFVDTVNRYAKKY